MLRQLLNSSLYMSIAWADFQFSQNENYTLGKTIYDETCTWFAIPRAIKHAPNPPKKKTTKASWDIKNCFNCLSGQCLMKKLSLPQKYLPLPAWQEPAAWYKVVLIKNLMYTPSERPALSISLVLCCRIYIIYYINDETFWIEILWKWFENDLVCICLFENSFSLYQYRLEDHRTRYMSSNSAERTDYWSTSYFAKKNPLKRVNYIWDRHFAENDIKI